MCAERRVEPQPKVKYPDSWVYVSTPQQARTYLTALIDSPIDAVRVQSSVGRDRLQDIFDRSYQMPQSHTSDAMEILRRSLPQEQRELIEKFPPYFIIAPRDFFLALGKVEPCSKSGVHAFYSNTDGTFPGVLFDRRSNVVFIREDEHTETRKEHPTSFTKELVHESLHYISATSRKSEITHFLDEGMTEFLTVKSTGTALTLENSFGVYPMGVMTISVFEQLVGYDEIQKAYLSGDTSKIRAKVDSIMGVGTFDILTADIDGNEKARLREWPKRNDLLVDLMISADIDPGKVAKELRELGKAYLPVIKPGGKKEVANCSEMVWKRRTG
ncbi:MAG: hypothetical protein ABID61_00455 [Candidatus Micrarchaeota archaeon]